MLLSALLSESGFSAEGLKDVTITGIVEDSRKAAPGTVFIARPGTKSDGGKFATDAVNKGSVVVITQAKIPELSAPQVIVPDAAAAASILANTLYGNPSKTGLKVLGVTGTNGKTTTTYLIRHLLAKSGIKCGLIGTVEIDDGKTAVESEMTTPGATDVAALLGTMKANGCGACAIEVSSHALDQKRAGAVQFAGAGFTNLTGDHLDYHKTMDAYAAAKGVLFELVAAGGVGVINGDDPWARTISKNCKGKVLSFSFGGGGDYRVSDISVTSAGTHFTLAVGRQTLRVEMILVGKHNIQNALVAIGLVHEVFGIPLAALAEGLKDAIGAPGRLQPVKVAGSKDVAVLVDYAHTDDALENVLTALKPLTRGKLRVVFGCGGDRDRTKRPRMARVAERLADVLYITSDNPRTEDPKAILSEIEAGLATPRLHPTVVEVDRRNAINQAVGEAQPGDVVLIAGKGHENYQIIGTFKHHFDDVEEAKRALEAR